MSLTVSNSDSNLQLLKTCGFSVTPPEHLASPRTLPPNHFTRGDCKKFVVIFTHQNYSIYHTKVNLLCTMSCIILQQPCRNVNNIFNITLTQISVMAQSMMHFRIQKCEHLNVNHYIVVMDTYLLHINILD